MRRGFTFSLPKRLVAVMDLKRGLVTRSAYLTNMLEEIYNMKIERPYSGQKFGDQGLNMVGDSTPSTPKEPMIADHE
jgi:hypothetical protein